MADKQTETFDSQLFGMTTIIECRSGISKIQGSGFFYNDFGDRIIKLNDFLLEQAANKKPGYKMVNGKRVYNKPVPVYLQSVSNLCNQLLRAGTSIGAKQLLEQ